MDATDVLQERGPSDTEPEGCPLEDLSLAPIARLTHKSRYLLEQLYHQPEHAAQEQLIATGDRRENVSESKGGTVMLRIRELALARDDDADHVQCKAEREELESSSALKL